MGFTSLFSHVFKPVTSQIIPTLAITYKWFVQQLDENNVILNRLPDEEVYMEQPQGFNDGKTPVVCILKRPYMVLNRLLSNGLDAFSLLLCLGFKANKCNPSLFIYSSQHTILYLHVYVDDITLIGNSTDMIKQLISKLNKAFSPKHLGDLDYFLGNKVKHMLDALSFSPRQSISKTCLQGYTCLMLH